MLKRTLERLEAIPHHSPAWFAIRQYLVDATASEFASQIGIGSSSKLQAYNKKFLGIERPVSDFLQHLFDRGNAAEAAVPDIINAPDVECEGPPLPTHLKFGDTNLKIWYEQKHHLLFGATADGLGDQCVVEIKYSSKGCPYPRPKLDHIPQVLGEMRAHGVKKCYYINVYETDSECGIVVWKIYFCPEVWDVVLEELAQFLKLQSAPGRMNSNLKKRLLAEMEKVRTLKYCEYKLRRPLPRAPTVPAMISERFQPSVEAVSANNQFWDDVAVVGVAL